MNFGFGRHVARPVDPRLVRARGGERDQRRELAVRVLRAHALVVGVQLGDVLRRALVGQQVGADADAARRVGHVDHRPFVMRRDLDRGVDAAGGRAADQQRDLLDPEVVVALHLGGDMLHLLEAGRDQARQADDVGALDARLREDVLARDHHAHVDDLEVVALEDDGDDVLADVVHVALDGGDDDPALGLDVAAGVLGGLLLGLDVRQQVRHRLLHHARALDHLRQEHLALAEEVADDVHARHQRAFDDVQRPAAARLDRAPGLLGVGDDELGDAVHQRVAEPLVDRAGAPGQARAVVLGRALGGLGDLDQAFAGGQQRLAGLAGRLPVQHHVLDALAQHGFEIVVDADHAGVDDAHVEPGADRVVEEHGVDRLAHRVVAAEAERHVADPAADLGAGQVRLDPARGLDEVDRVVVVLLDAGGDGEDVRVEDDVLGREADLVDEDPVGARADARSCAGRCRPGLARRRPSPPRPRRSGAPVSPGAGTRPRLP